MDGLLENLLPARKRATKHHEAIPYTDLPAVVARLRSARGIAARAVEFIALTAVRLGDLQGMTWAEIDNDVWTIPAQRVKTRKKDHVVPLSDRSLVLLKAQRERATSAVVFGGYVEGKSVSQPSMMEALRRAAADDTVTIHGLRSTFRDWCGDCTSYPREVAEAALAHAVGNETEAAYRRETALEKRRQLMSDWASYLNGGK